MQSLLLHINTPVYLESHHHSLIPPVVLDDIVYFIKEKTFFDVITLIKKMQDYLTSVRTHGYEYTNTWLKTKGLLNHGFLESTSEYCIKDCYYEKSVPFIPCQKDLLSGETAEKTIRESVKNVLVYKCISDNRKEFNDFVKNKLVLLRAELADPCNHNRRNFLQKNIYRFLIAEFLAKDEYSEYYNFHLNKLNAVRIVAENDFDNNDFTIYNIYNVKSLWNWKFKKVNSANVECLNLNKHIKLTVYGATSEEIEQAIVCSQELTKRKLEGEKKYLQGWYPVNKEKSTNGAKICERFNSTLTTKNRVKINNLGDNNNFINYIFMNANYSNFLIDSTQNFEKMACVLNLDSDLYEDFNLLMNDKRTSCVTKLANNHDLIMPVGYAIIEF